MRQQNKKKHYRGKIGNMERFLKEEDAPPGFVVEIGVHRGNSFYYLLNADPNRRCIGYDTFSGMPPHGEYDNHHREGDFSDTSLQEVRKFLEEESGNQRYTLVEGVYPESDTIFPKPIALAHIDADLYTSVKNSLWHLAPLMAKGGRIYLDDPFVDTCRGATKALEEWCREYDMKYDIAPGNHAYIQF
jgi:hypothetical protein